MLKNRHGKPDNRVAANAMEGKRRAHSETKKRKYASGELIHPMKKYYLTKEQVEEVLKKYNSQWLAAESLGISQMTLSRAKRKFGIMHDGKILANKSEDKINKQIKTIKGMNERGEIFYPQKGKPLPKETRIKISKSLEGKPSWNKGKANLKTSECYVCGIKFKHGQKRKRKTCSRKCSAVVVSALNSDGRLKGNKNPNYGNRGKVHAAIARGCYKNVVHKSYTRGKWTIYNKIKMRSTWEASYAQYLDKINIKWQYEFKIFYLSDGRHYTPDFYLIDKDELLAL